ncbi:MAG: prepilin-type N-terminal cleavage/methylation domain-containing protein [Luteolibacter sp.]|uniref:type II secretion system protein n=1 Tax=Luteolibacter sp. TaxID=1962973 RepID=UPI003263E394
MRKSSHYASDCGFTLVELLVVVLIIAVLAVLGFQGYRVARLRANQIVSTTNLRQLATANLLYATDHSTYAPAGDPANLIRWHGGRASVTAKFDPAKGYLSEYLGESRSVGICPEFKEHLTGSDSWEEGSGGYGYNSIYIGGMPQDTFTPNRPAGVNNPARTLMFATTALAKAGGLQEYASADPPKEVFASWRLGGSLQPSVHFRFNGRALVAWCDGHISEELSNGNSATNFYGGNNQEAKIGFCGPAANNGWWNPRN